MSKTPYGRLWSGYGVGSDRVKLVSDIEIDRIMKGLEYGSSVFGVNRDTEPRRVDCIQNNSVYVPSRFFDHDRCLDPGSVESTMIPRYGGVKPTPGGNARLIMSDVINSVWTPGLPWWLSQMILRNYFRGPLMVGTGLFMPDAVQIDLSSAYLWALSQSLPFGFPVEIERPIESLISAHMTGSGQIMIDDRLGLLRTPEMWKIPGQYLFTGPMVMVQEGMRLGFIEPMSKWKGWIFGTSKRNIDLITSIEDSAMRKMVYQLGWPTYDQGYSSGRVINSSSDLTHVDLIDKNYSHLVWRYIPPGSWRRGNPHIASHVCGLVSMRIIEIVKKCLELSIDHGNIIVDSIVIPRSLADKIKTLDSPGNWRVSKGPGMYGDLQDRFAGKRTWFDCSDTPTRYKAGDEKGRLW